MRKFIALVVISILIITTAVADTYIGSRDFGSDEAEWLMMLAQSELGDASATDKAALMYNVLAHVWETGNSIERTILNGNYESVKNGTFFTAVPDAKCEQAVEMIYSGWDGAPVDIGLVWAYRIVRILEFWLPVLIIGFVAMLFTLVSIGLANLQDRMLNRMRENNLKDRR